MKSFLDPIILRRAEEQSSAAVYRGETYSMTDRRCQNDACGKPLGMQNLNGKYCSRCNASVRLGKDPNRRRRTLRATHRKAGV